MDSQGHKGEAEAEAVHEEEDKRARDHDHVVEVRASHNRDCRGGLNCDGSESKKTRRSGDGAGDGDRDGDRDYDTVNGNGNVYLNVCGTDYATYIARQCRERRHLHNESRRWYKNRYQFVTISSIVLGFAIAAISQLPLDGVWFKYVIGILALLQTTNAAVNKFLGYESLQSEHSLAAQKFLKLWDTVRLHLCMSADKRENADTFMARISQEYETILSSAPMLVCHVSSLPKAEQANLLFFEE